MILKLKVNGNGITQTNQYPVIPGAKVNPVTTMGMRIVWKSWLLFTTMMLVIKHSGTSAKFQKCKSGKDQVSHIFTLCTV